MAVIENTPDPVSLATRFRTCASDTPSLSANATNGTRPSFCSS